jgi:hypothetical protein
MEQVMVIFVVAVVRPMMTWGAWSVTTKVKVLAIGQRMFLAIWKEQVMQQKWLQIMALRAQ